MVAELLTPSRRATPGMRELLLDVRHGPDRLLHSVRRRIVCASIRERSPVGSILVICQGNICRSPYAAAVLRRLLARRGIVVSSAGFIGRPGRRVPPDALDVARCRGFDLGGHRSRTVTPAMARDSDIVVAMDAEQASELSWYARNTVILGDFDPRPINKRAIRDPLHMPYDVFVDVFGRIDRCAEVLAQAIE
jgi:protein-tyrosine phosphatase